jgi:predicted enzyme related to lactoylglutathione lyase
VPFDIHFDGRLGSSRFMPAPIVHLEFRSFDFARTSAFYAKVFDWQTQQNAQATYMKHDADDGSGPEGASAGWVRAAVSQAPGPLAYVVVDDLAATLAEVERNGGRVLVPKLPFAGGGEVALFADPDGNVVGLWVRKSGPSNGSAPKAAATAPPAKAPAAAKPAAAKPDKKPKPAKKR